MGDELAGRVVVVTGAASGIGRATARRLARLRAHLVLTSRRLPALQRLARECEELGAEAVAVAADVTNPDAVKGVVSAGLERFGRIDAWLNVAGVYLVGSFEETPPDAFRRVMEVNFMGYLNGARAILPVFRRQGSGTLVNLSSGLGRVAAPNLSAYSASKFAIRGFSEALRLELRGSGIDVCAVFPASMDTPIYETSANYSGRPIRPIPPVYPADRTAAVIVRCLRHPRGERLAGGAVHLLDVTHAGTSRAFDLVFSGLLRTTMFDEGTATSTSGNHNAPVEGTDTVEGGWPTGWIAAAGWLRRRLRPHRSGSITL